MAKIPIKNLQARMILDSRGEPTIEVTATTANGHGVFGVPSGVSKGKAEALDLRDGGRRFFGKGVHKALSNVNSVIASKIVGMDVLDQQKLDEALIDLDGMPNKSNLGANAILGVSGAVCKAAADSKNLSLYKYVGALSSIRNFFLPQPMINVINGGQHGDTNLDIQEFMLVPTGRTFSDLMEKAIMIFHRLKEVLRVHNFDTDLGNEGGYSPDWESNRQVFEMLTEAIKKSDMALGKDINLALDVAATNLFKKDDKQYVLNADRTSLSAERLVSLYKEWVEKYKIVSIEDGLAEEDWAGWQMMKERLPKNLMIVGDDLFATQVERLNKGIELKVGNAVIIKPNQVGTITEALETVKTAHRNKYKVIASHRSGETNDDFIADFAVGIGAQFIKAGSVARGERVSKYNRLLEIETELRK